MSSSVIKVASFSDGDQGGNPAGVYIADALPEASVMQSIAADVGFSETAFAEPANGGWRVRYFSPEQEVPFCGHATIALGAVLAEQNGAGVFSLTLNDASITVEGSKGNGLYQAALQSPNTHSKPLDDSLLSSILELFGLSDTELDKNLPPAFANAGANHAVIALNSRTALRAMNYSLDAGKQLMNDAQLVTIMLVHSESDRLFHSRNAFASSGVFEDPATGAASAAFAGYLRDIQWPHGGSFNIIQGEDMGSKSLIEVELGDEVGSSIRVSGAVRYL